jgi:hypothetical protein
MEKEKFDEWLEKLGKAWCDLNPEQAVSLFLKDVEYYENVFEKPCNSWEEVFNLWKVIPENQKNVSFEYEVVCIKDDLAVANWKVTRTLIPSNKKQDIDGIFIIKLNNQGLCNYFKQWRAVKER